MNGRDTATNHPVQPCALRRRAASALRGVAVAVALVAALVPAAQAQTVPDLPPEVEELRSLLASPAVQDWLRGAPAAVPAETPAASDDILERGLERIARRRDHIAATIPRAPAEIAEAVHALGREAAARGWALTLLMVAALVGAGLAVEWRFQRATRAFRKSVLSAAEDTVPERLAKLGLRVALAAGAVASFAGGSLGVLLLLPLPPRAIGGAARIILAVIAFRILRYACQILLAPEAPERRVVPMTDAVAAFWTERIITFGAIVAAGWAVAQVLLVLGVSMPVHLLVGYVAFGIVAVLTVIWIWQRRHRDLGMPKPSLAAAIAWTAYVIALYLAWIAGAVFVLAPLLVAGLLPLAVGVVNRAVNHLLREGPPAPDGTAGERPPSVLAAAIERGARLNLILASTVFLLWAWDISLEEIVSASGRDGVIARVVLYLAAVMVIFDFLWHIIRTAIDSWIAKAEGAATDPEEARHRARMRTLLPILRNVLQAAFAIIGVMMILAAVGVDIAPLIAGAGVVGVAVGFGAQSAVKDIIAGMFYLLDDAFRVGEYIVAGSAKGTVESFSIRSIKLRHHRGPVYTIPFGSLGAIQNLSRDYVIEKQSVTVVYGTDLAKAKKVIKQVAADLMADPELGPSFIEPVKLQGVESLGDNGLVLRVKFTARPGEQFTIRRRMLAAIERQFNENGIEIAFPTVRVFAEDEPIETAGAAAARALAPPTAAQ
ncbi:MAG: mechanosensitive ion channel family protein [Gemmobacter sp.]